jgi:drug/metabolite transporter (DMT)-like permease
VYGQRVKRRERRHVMQTICRTVGWSSVNRAPWCSAWWPETPAHCGKGFTLTILAFSLVLASAVLHAVWNLFTKNVGGGITFVWLFSALGTLVYTPVLAISILLQPLHLSLTSLLFLSGTCLLHIFYYWLLNRGYQHGDLSLVYPLSRGTGPLLATLGAILLMGERPTLVALGGSLLTALGIIILAGDPRKFREQRGVAYGVFTGCVIAAYTLWDKQTVSMALVTPLLLNWASNLTRALLLAPIALRQRAQVQQLWRAHWREALGVAVLDPLSYILFLIALSFSMVSYLAPLRQVSILITALIGAHVLAEGQVRRRMIAAVAMTIGLLIVALG